MIGPKRYDATDIILRAEELGVQLSVQNGELRVKAAKGVVTQKMMGVFKEHKAELVKALTPLCFTCLDAGIETPALDEEYDSLSYCLQHHPLYNGDQGKRQFSHAVGKIAATFPEGCSVHFDPPGYTIEDRAREIVIAERSKQRAKRMLGRSDTVISMNERRRRIEETR